MAYKDRLDAWVNASAAWLQNRYSDRIINAVLHLDEATPHIQYLILPLDDNGKLNCKAMFGGSKYVLSQLQSDYANAVAHLGLTRGREGSKAKHTEVAEYYASAQNVEHTAIPELPTVDDIQPPEPPSIAARIKTENLIAYAKEAGVKAAADLMAKLAPALETLITQNANSQLSQANAAFKAAAKRMRELSLDQVLVKMYGATEAPDSKPKNKTRAFKFPDGLTIEVTDKQWRSQDTGRKDKGAINLAMYLSGYGQDNYQQAIRDMVEIFGDQNIAGSLANYMMDAAPQQVTRIGRQKFTMPEPNRHTWPDVRDHLIRKLKFQPDFIDQAHEDGLVFSDKRSNCVFPRADASGVFKIGIGDKLFNQSLGKDGSPFVINGANDKAYIVESPLEALSFKTITPESTIIATNGFMQPDKLKPYLDQNEQLRQSTDAACIQGWSPCLLSQRFCREHA